MLASLATRVQSPEPAYWKESTGTHTHCVICKPRPPQKSKRKIQNGVNSSCDLASRFLCHRCISVEWAKGLWCCLNCWIFSLFKGPETHFCITSLSLSLLWKSLFLVRLLMDSLSSALPEQECSEDLRWGKETVKSHTNMYCHNL